MQLTWEVVDGKVRFNGRALGDWVPEVVDAIVAAADPVQVILHGSVAKGSDGPNSDIDLLVVLPEMTEPRHRLMSWLGGVATVGPGVDVTVTDLEEMARRADIPGSLVYDPIRNGRVVYERP